MSEQVSELVGNEMLLIPWFEAKPPLKFCLNNSRGPGGTKSILRGFFVAVLGFVEVNRAADSAVDDTDEIM